MRCAQSEALSGDPTTQDCESPPPALCTLGWYPLASYSPRGTITSQQPRGWLLASSAPQPSQGASTLVSASNSFWPVPAALVDANWTSLESNWLKSLLRLFP